MPSSAVVLVSRRPRQRERSDEEDGNRRLAIAFVILVGLSAGTIALQSDGSWLQVGVFILGGIGVGGVLAWYLTWMVGRSPRIRR